MIEGALIFSVGIVVGAIGVILNPDLYRNKRDEKPAETPYDRYKNKDGLYSRKAVKESR